MLTELKARLGSELDRLAYELTAAVPDTPGTASGSEDRRALERQKELQQYIRHLGQLVAGLASADPTMIWLDRAGFGSRVRVRNLATREVLTYTLVTGELIDLDAGQVSLASPIGQALLGRRRGDEVNVHTPQGVRQFQILSLLTLPQMLGIEMPRQAACA